MRCAEDKMLQKLYINHYKRRQSAASWEIVAYVCVCMCVSSGFSSSICLLPVYAAHAHTGGLQHAKRQMPHNDLHVN